MNGKQLLDILNRFDTEALEQFELRAQVGEGESRPLISVEWRAEISDDGNHRDMTLKIAGSARTGEKNQDEKKEQGTAPKEREALGEKKKAADRPAEPVKKDE